MRKWKIINNLLLVLLVLTIFLLITIHLPPKQTIFQSKITNQRIGTYDLNISIPKNLRYGKDEQVFLELTQILTEDNLSSTTSNGLVNLEIDLILTGGNIHPPGLLVTPLIRDKDIQLNWEISTENYDEIPGSVRVFIHPTAASGSSNQSRELIFSKDFSVDVINFLNIRFGWIQTLLFSQLLILSGLFLYSNFKKNRTN